jgi:hypothetical protein
MGRAARDRGRQQAPLFRPASTERLARWVPLDLDRLELKTQRRNAERRARGLRAAASWVCAVYTWMNHAIFGDAD